MALAWRRPPGESPAAFERRVVDAILLARHLPPLPKPLPTVEALRAAAPVTPEPRVSRIEPKHIGSKLASASYKPPHKPRAAHYRPRVKVSAG